MMHSQQVKRAARSRARRYVRNGIIDPEPCAVCGLEDAEMHHPDYARPWMVEWRCRWCHSREHHASRDAGQLLLWLGA